MVFCTEFLDGWWSLEPLRKSCVRCGWCRAHGNIREEDARSNNPHVYCYSYKKHRSTMPKQNVGFLSDTSGGKEYFFFYRQLLTHHYV